MMYHVDIPEVGEVEGTEVGVGAVEEERQEKDEEQMLDQEQVHTRTSQEGSGRLPKP